MSFETAGKCPISFPTSLIKAPGALLKDKKDPFEVRANRDNIQNLLGTFKNKVQSPFCSFTQIPYPTSCETQNDRFAFIKETRNLLFTEAMRSPGKLKSDSDKISDTFQKAKDLLSIYNIDLAIEDSKVSLEIHNLLKVLIPEISFFPSDFFKKLQINKLILCKQIFCNSCSNSNISLCVYLLDSKEKVRERFYKIIFDHLVITNSEIFRLWKEIKLKEGNNNLIEDSSFQNFEDAFMGLMKNTNHALLRPTTRKLRELLANYYPEAMSEERFKTRNREKKKTYRVRFETEPY